MKLDYVTLYKAWSTPSLEFSTKWAISWSKNVVDFSEVAETLTSSNIRPIVYEAQREFEKHLSEVMYHRPHQQEF